jgi:hypothetical protein
MAFPMGPNAARLVSASGSSGQCGDNGAIAGGPASPVNPRDAPGQTLEGHDIMGRTARGQDGMFERSSGAPDAVRRPNEAKAAGIEGLTGDRMVPRT